MAITVIQAGALAPPVGNLILTQLFFWRSGQIGICGCHFRISSGTYTSIRLGDIALEVQTAIDAFAQPLMDTDTSILGCKVTAPEITPVLLSGIASSDSEGTQAAPGLPGQDSGIITKTTENSGRTFRGRAYVPFPYTAAQDTDDTPTAEYVTALAGFAGAWITTQAVTVGGENLNMRPALYNRATAVITDITGFVAKKAWATQRRRGNFGRANGPFIA